MATPGPIDIVIMISYIVVCISFLSAGVNFLLKARGKHQRIRNYLLGIGIFMLLYGSAKVIVFLFELTFEIDYIWNITATEFEIIFTARPDLELYHEFIWRLTTGIGTAGLVIFIYELEILVMEKKTKFVFTILAIVTVIPALVFGTSGKDALDWVRIVLYIGNILVVFVPLFYFYLAFKTTGDTRKRAIGAAVGMLLTFAGVIFNSSIGKSLTNQIVFTYLFFGILVFLGVIVYSKSIRFDSRE